jgi:hypothetical protein
MKLNLGCGNDIKEGYFNVDSVALPGVDLVHDLESMPWPLADGCAEEVLLFHVLEHMDGIIPTLEELHRITRRGGVIRIRVPYYNSPAMFADPTHRTFISDKTFDFFDPSKPACRERPYYSHARFTVTVSTVYIRVLSVYIPIRFGPPKRLLIWLAQRVGALIWAIEFELEVL